MPSSFRIKRGPLTTEEEACEIVKEHTTRDAAILAGSAVPAIRMAESIALSHHEQCGWHRVPDGAEGMRHSVERPTRRGHRRLDALVCDRVYRSAIPESVAIEILKAGRETHFDPEVLDAFLTMLPEAREIAATTGDLVAAMPTVRW